MITIPVLLIVLAGLTAAIFAVNLANFIFNIFKKNKDADKGKADEIAEDLSKEEAIESEVLLESEKDKEVKVDEPLKPKVDKALEEAIKNSLLDIKELSIDTIRVKHIVSVEEAEEVEAPAPTHAAKHKQAKEAATETDIGK